MFLLEKPILNTQIIILKFKKVWYKLNYVASPLKVICTCITFSDSKIPSVSSDILITGFTGVWENENKGL